MIKYSCIFFGIFVQFYLNAAEELKRDDKQTYVKNTSSPGSFLKKARQLMRVKMKIKIFLTIYF
jgi:hypothetical protein